MMQPKNIVVTGGNSGVGYETVKGLYLKGHHVIFGSRNTAKNQEAVTQIRQTAGGTVTAFNLDLASRKSVEQFANNVKSKFGHIDILINNAGLILSGDRQISELGLQMTLTINHFGPFYLTYLLWGSLVKAPEARIINVSSELHYRAPQDYLQDMECRNKSFSSMTQYSISKIYNVLFTRGLNDLIAKKNLKNVKTACLHPGLVDTGFGHDSGMMKCFKALCCCLFINQQNGARTSLHLSNIPFAQVRNGEYYDADTRIKQMDQRGRNAADVAKLWVASQKAYGISFN